MQNREFENAVRQKMEELNITPAAAIWDKIAAGLPPEKKRRRRIVFFLVLLLLLSGSLTWYLLMQGNKNNNSIAAKEKNNSGLIHTSIAAVKKNAENIADSTMALHKNDPQHSLPVNPKTNLLLTDATLVHTKIKLIATGKKVQNSLTIKNTGMRWKSPAGNSMQVLFPAASTDTTSLAYATPNLEEVAMLRIGVFKNDSSISISDTTNAVIRLNKKDSLQIIPTMSKDTLRGMQMKVKKNTLKWETSVLLSYGYSTVKNKIFSNESVFANDIGSSQSSPPVTGTGFIPANPTPDYAFTIGLQAKKMLNKQFDFATGLYYSRQSNTVKVGNRVDTLTSFNFYNQQITVDNYYSSGNSKTYRNTFRVLQIPILIQYNISKKIPLHIQGGAALGYLFQSNALGYNSAAGAWFTDRDLFKTFLLSFKAGAGISLFTQKKHPVALGISFEYSAGSVTRNSFNKQHLTNAMLVLKIPLKKYSADVQR